MTMQIRLSRGAVALVDDDEYESLTRYKWGCNSSGYAERRARKDEFHQGQGRPTIMMHRQVIGAPPGISVDHIDGNKLNNQQGLTSEQ